MLLSFDRDGILSGTHFVEFASSAFKVEPLSVVEGMGVVVCLPSDLEMSK